MKLPKFKIGITFSGKYRRQYVEPICIELLKLGYSEDDIFYDEWHDDLINGPHGDRVLSTIYKQQCELIVVLLSPDYKERCWPGNIEWPAVKELINEGRSDKICLLSVDSVEVDKIDGLYRLQTIYKRIDGLPPMQVAQFIKRVYRRNDISGSILDANVSAIDGIYSKPGRIASVMGGVMIQEKWITYFTDLMFKIMYYMENYSDADISENESFVTMAYHRSEIMILTYLSLSEDRESAERMRLEVWDSYINEKKMGTCVLKIDTQNDIVKIWEYIPGDWDDRIFSWR